LTFDAKLCITLYVLSFISSNTGIQYLRNKSKRHVLSITVPSFVSPTCTVSYPYSRIRIRIQAGY
jgi:hypothetical protein